MQDIENNNWIVSDQLENIHEIYTNMNVMTFSKLTTFE